MVRYADDLLALRKARREAESAIASFEAILAEMALELKHAKTRIVHLREGGEGVDFLGFHHRWARHPTAGTRHIEFLASLTLTAGDAARRKRVRELTARDQLRWPIEQVVGDLNRFLRDWVGYFRYGNSTVQFDRMIRHTERRRKLWIAHSHQHPWSDGHQ